MVKRMQSAVELGRKIRDNKLISLKTPLSKVTIVEQDPEAVKDYETLAPYIKEELNCLELEILTNEGEYVTYLSDPDNKLVGGELKGDYKKVKGRLQKLTKEEVAEYLSKGQVVIEGHTIKEGWLKISKEFLPKYKT